MKKILNTKDFEKMERRFRATFFNSVSGYKSVNLIGTSDEKGHTNLAVFNSIFHLGANPPLIGFIVRPHTVERHTFENIIETKEFTINHIAADFFKKAHQTSAKYPREISEFEACDLTAEFIENFKAPFVAESNIKFGLKFVDKKDIEQNGTIFMIGQIEKVILGGDYIGEDGFVDLEKAESVTCVGLDAYYKPEKLARLSYAQPETFPKEI